MQEQGGNGAARWPSAGCREFDAQLSDYLEGADRPAVATHAADCDFCGAILADLALMRSASMELGNEEPPARVWTNVRAALAAEGLIHAARNPWRRAMWLLRPAPALGLAAIVLLGVMALRTSARRHSSAGTQVAEAVDPVLVQSVSQMESAFRAHSAQFSPTVEQAYEADLVSLDGEIKECNDTLDRQPGDTLSREYLASAYTEKARVLESALESGGQ